MRKRLAYLIPVAAAAAGAVAIGLYLFLRPAVEIDQILAAYREDGPYGRLTITCPLDETLFPPEIVPPTFRWDDGRQGSNAWLVMIDFQDGADRMTFLTLERQWTPSPEPWERIKQGSSEKRAKVTVVGVDRANPAAILSAGAITISTSRDEVGASIFYREVNLPFIDAVKDPSHIRWRLGAISSAKQPPIVLENLPVCGNCHSFSADGRVLGMDVDYANDKGSYAIARVAEQMVLDKGNIITWSDYEKEDPEPTFGLLSRVSPDGRYVVSTVKDRSVFVAKDDLAFSQLFFPLKGILAVYDRETKRFQALPGADDKRFVQSNPTWSPDGQEIVFARSKAHRLQGVHSDEKVLLNEAECREFLQEGKTFLFDLYRIPFNEGRGGKPEPLKGASHNGTSNYFAKYSPDGKWIVFCKAQSFMLLQPDSELFIIPASGGKARRLRCNTPRMNSWHSWSPNGKWLVFSSKANSAYTQLFLTHVDDEGHSTPALLLSQFTAPDRAANIPEFVDPRAPRIVRIGEQFLDAYSYVRAGQEFLFQGDYDAAVGQLQKALDIDPRSADALCNLGIVLGRQGRYEEAMLYLVQAIEHQPDNKDAHLNLGNILSLQRRYQEAIAHHREAVRIDPASFEARLGLGAALMGTGALPEAAEHLSEAARLGSNDPRAHYYLGLALEKQGQAEEAAGRYSRALEYDPEYLKALLGLAWIRATHALPKLRDGEQALRLAIRACELTRSRDPQVMDVLGAALAECGRFEEAAFTAQRALDAARSAGNDELACAIQGRVELYQGNKPFRHAGRR